MVEEENKTKIEHDGTQLYDRRDDSQTEQLRQTNRDAIPVAHRNDEITHNIDFQGITSPEILSVNDEEKGGSKSDEEKSPGIKLPCQLCRDYAERQ